LEWVPGEQLPLPENLEVDITGLRDGCRIPLPPRKVMTSPLQLRMAGYYDHQVVGSDEDGDEVERVERYQSFSTVRELIDFMLCRDHRGMWFFAHAGGLADMQFVLDELLTEIKRMSGVGRTSTVMAPDGSKKTEEHIGSEWKIRASFSGSSAIIVHVSKGKNAWHFCDSYWLLRDKLASIGKAIGIHKGDSPEAKAWMSERFGREITDFEQLSQPEKVVFYRDVPLPILTGYNRTDCEILWKAIFQFEEEILGLGGQLQQTIASTAMTLFRRSYLQQEIYTSEKLNQVAQESYFASRVEVLSRNVTDFLMYDINSSFPYAMTFALPGNLTGFQTTLPDDDRDECLYVANVTLEVPDMHMPPLPFRREGRVFFPTGRWRAWLTSTDIRLALREGAILHKVHEVYLFEPFWDFRAYAEEIYARRAASETPFRKLILKYLLNSLYGKAAEGIVKQEMLINPDEVDRTKMQMLQPGVWLQEKEAVIAHRHVVVSSFITAIARRTLFDFAKECYRQDKPLMYCDSVTGDRTVVLRSSEGRVYVDPIEVVWGKFGGAGEVWHCDKEAVVPVGWSALARDSSGVEGWFPLRRIIRHKTSKPVYMISSKRGQVGVTEDHSLMVGGVETRPADFVDRRSQFDVVGAPPPTVAEKIDLLSYLEGFQRIIETGERHGGKIVHRFVECEEPDWIKLTTFRKSSLQRFRRYYSRGSEELRSLLRVTAAFISEGSSSLRGVTTDTRDMFSLCQKDRGWLDRLKSDLGVLTREVVFTGPLWSEGSGVYYLRSGAGLMACLFGELGGVRGSRGRKLPSFIYELDDVDFEVFWKKMVEGDGNVDPWGHVWYTTISQQLAAGLSFALSQHGYDHSIHYRPSKKSYTIRLRKGVERKGRKTHVEVSQYDGFVYDLEVDGAHTFVDGVGRVLLHNTDSLCTKADLPVDDKKLGALKLEKKMDWAEFVAPKIYLGEGYELNKDGTWSPKLLNKAKGFSLGAGQAAFDKLNRIVGGERVGVQRMTRLRELYRTQVDGQHVTAPFEMMVIKALTFETLCKRFHYPDGETRPWSIEELKSGDCYPRGFDFDEDSWARVDGVTRAAMMRSVRSS
jgi:hypothetical protein